MHPRPARQAGPRIHGEVLEGPQRFLVSGMLLYQAICKWDWCTRQKRGPTGAGNLRSTRKELP